MNRGRLINPDLLALIASLGHTETIVIADAGLPIPVGVPRLDLSLVRGTPSFLAVLEAVSTELIIESATLVPKRSACSIFKIGAQKSMISLHRCVFQRRWARDGHSSKRFECRLDCSGTRFRRRQKHEFWLPEHQHFRPF